MVFTVTPAHVGVSDSVKNMSQTFSVNIIVMLELVQSRQHML